MEIPESDLISNNLFNTIPVTVVIYAPVWNDEQDRVIDFEIYFCNEAACSFMGTTSENLLGSKLSTLPYLDPDAKAKAFEDCLVAWNSPTQVIDHYFNEVRDVYLEIIRIRKGNQIICVFNDQTHKFKSELESKIAAEELDAIFNASLSAMYLAEIIYNQENNVEDLRFLRVNRSYLKITNQIYSEVIGKKLSEVSPLTMRTDFIKNLDSIVKTETEEVFEVYYPTTGKYFNFSGVKLSSHRIVVTFNDATRQRQAEEALKEQFKLTEALLDSSLYAICAHKIIRNSAGEFEDLEFAKVNRMAETILGLTEDVVGKRWLSIYPDARNNETFEACRQVIETGGSVRKEIRYDANGLNGWFDYTLVKLPNDGLMVTIADITESKLNQLKVQESRKFLQDILDGTSTGMVLLEKVGNKEITDFRVKAVNKNVSASMNASPDDIVGRYFTEIFPDCKENGFFDKYKQVLLTGNETNFEYEQKSGEHSFWLDVVAKKIGNEVLVSFNNITRLKKLMVDLKQTNIDLHASQENEFHLKKLNEYKDEFLNIASHELKTPVTTIKACLQILGKNVAFNKNSEEFYGRARKNLTTLERLISDLLDVSKASVGKLTIIKEPINPSHLISEVVNSFKDSYPSRTITKSIEVNGEISGDLIRLEQVLNNIIGNAIKYTQEAIIIKAFEQENELNIWVQDFGKGIEKDDVENLFNRFYRSSSIKHIQGLGLGLYLSNEIVTAHGGKIEVDSVLGKGSVFKIRIPID